MLRINLYILIFFFVSTSAIAQTSDELLGKSSTKDASKWTHKNGYVLLKEVYEAYDRMAKDAKKDGVDLRIISAYRSFADQKMIWERKWNDGSRKHMKKKDRAIHILRWSSMPGTSRHHWGTEIDLNTFKLAFYQTPKGKKMHNWLTQNAGKYGFFQPYTEGRTKGYQAEKWHWSYKSIADRYEKQFLKKMKDDDFKNFLGSEMATELGIIEGWVRITM